MYTNKITDSSESISDKVWTVQSSNHNRTGIKEFWNQKSIFSRYWNQAYRLTLKRQSGIKEEKWNQELKSTIIQYSSDIIIKKLQSLRMLHAHY